MTEVHRRRMDAMLNRLAQFLETPAGIETLNHMRELAVRVRERATTEASRPSLSPREAKASSFIQREKRHGRRLSVRAVARALGFRSSRTGFLIMRALREKKMVS